MSQRPGFTLTEVMIAMFILSATMFVLSELQVKSMVRVWQGREEIDRLYIIKKYLYRMLLDSDKAKSMKQQFNDPEMKLMVEPRDISKKSSLASFAKELRIFNSTGTWQRASSTKAISIITFAPRAPERQS